MRTLLLKDLRLAGDGLVPWAIMLIGLGIFSLPMVWWQQSLGTGWAMLDSVGEFLMAVSIVVGVTAPFVAAAIAALVLHGDRRHGAEAAMASMPIAPIRRIAAKTLAIVAAATVPPLVVLALHALGPILDVRVRPDRLEQQSLALALVGSAVAIGLVLATGPTVRSMMRSLLLALILGVVAIGAALVAHAIVAEWTVAPYRDASVGSLHQVGTVVTAAEEREATEWIARGVRDAAVFAAFAAPIAMAAAGALVGLVGLAKPRRTRWCVVALGLAAIAPAITGAIVTSRVLEATVVNANHHVARALRVRAATDERIIDAVVQLMPGAAAGRYVPDGWSLMEEGRRRVLALPDAERTGHPIAAAIRRTRDLSTESHAVAWLTRSVDSLPDRLADALDVVERFPGSHNSRWRLIWFLREWIGPARSLPTPTPGSDWELMQGRSEQTRSLMFAWHDAQMRHRATPDHPQLEAARAALEAHRAIPLPDGAEERSTAQEAAALLRHAAELGHPQAERMRALATRIEEAVTPRDR